MNDLKSFWNERYAKGYIYGKAPNDFLRSVAEQLTGPVLSLGEGQGRNAVYLASKGLDVTGVDASDEAVAGAQRLAEEQKVSANFAVADLSSYPLGEARWGSIYSIFCHLPSQLRRDVHARVVRALKPGGLFVLEAYSPRQLAHRTGGPQDIDLLVEPDAVGAELHGLHLERVEELERDVREGTLHGGLSAVVQVVARKPSPPRGPPK